MLFTFVTEVYRAENRIVQRQKKEIEDLNQAQKHFFSSMSHEIRTPVNAIIGLNEMTLREEISDEVDTSDMNEEELAEYEAQKHLIAEYNKAMSYDRNDQMLQKAVSYLESGDVVFYAVGLAHLLSEDGGLVDALRAAGYTVELVQYK
jgi:signal transduction histidine kinase